MLMASNSVNFTIVSWNVRGLGDADKCKLVKDSLLTARVDIACLQESKLRTITSAKPRSFLPPHLTDFHCAEAVGSRGGIITAWNARAFTASAYIARRHTLTSFFTSTSSDTVFAITNVYAPADHRDSRSFLDDLSTIAAQVPGNWFLMGDFNLIRGVRIITTGLLTSRSHRLSMTR